MAAPAILGTLPRASATSGARLWARRYAGPSYDQAASIAASPDGSRVFATGYSYGSGTSGDYLTIAYNASTGAHEWSRRYAGSADDEARAVAVSPDSTTVFITGYSVGSSNDRDYLTIAYDASTGTPLWWKRSS